MIVPLKYWEIHTNDAGEVQSIWRMGSHDKPIRKDLFAPAYQKMTEAFQEIDRISSEAKVSIGRNFFEVER